MMMILAQSTDRAKELAERAIYKEPTSMPSFHFEFMDQFEAWAKNITETTIPSLNEVVGGLQQIGMPTGIVLGILGLAFLIFGWRLFQFLAVLNLAILGTLAGGVGAIQLGWSHWWLGMLIGGLSLLVLGFPLLKGYIVICGMLIGAAVGFITMYYSSYALGQSSLADMAWIGAIVGAVVLTVPLFLIFRIAIMMLTSLQGAILVVICGASIALKSPQVAQTVHDYLVDWPLSPLVAILAVAILGLAIQLAWWFRQQAEGDDGEPEFDPTRPQIGQSY
jgi:hypothetical protein